MGKSLIIKGADFSVNGIVPEYTPVEWISPRNNSQYINTGFTSDGKAKIVVEFALTNDLLDNTNVGNKCDLMGVKASADASHNNYLCIFWLPYSSSDKRAYGSSGARSAGWYSNDSFITDTNKHTAELDQSRFVLDNVLINSTETPVLLPGSFPIYALGANDKIESQLNNLAKFYRFKIYSDYTDADSLVFDAVPVKRTEDDKVCLYDLVSGNYFYTNDGYNPTYPSE